MAQQNQQQPQGDGVSRGIIHTMQQDLDRAQGRGGDAFEEIASSSPLPPQAPAPQENPDDILGIDMKPPSAPTPPAPVSPAPQAPPVAPTPAQPLKPQQLSEEELDALLPLGDTPAQAQQPSAPAQQAPSQDYGSVARRMPQQAAPTPSPAPANPAPQPRPMDDIATPSPNQAPATPRATGGNPPPNLPTGSGPDLNVAPSQFSPAPPSAPLNPAPQPVPPAPAPQPVPPLTPSASSPIQRPIVAGLEEGEEVPGQTPEQLLGLDEPLPPPAQAPAPPQNAASSVAPSAATGPTFVEEESSPFASRTLILISATLFLSALVGTLSYFLFFSGTEQEPSPTPPPAPPAQEESFIPPSPLVTPDETEELVITETTQQALLAGIQSLQEREVEPGAIVYVPIRLQDTTDGNSPQYLSTQLFFETLDIALPEDFLSSVNSTFMLYLYGAGEEEELVCDENEAANTTCVGPRVGIVLSRRPSAPVTSEELLASWVQEDMSTFEPLILDEATLDSSTALQEGTYASPQTPDSEPLPVYYVNLPHSATALNFGIGPDDTIVLGTSKNSLYTMLDALVAEN